MKFRNAYNSKTVKSQRIVDYPVTLAVQDAKDECDVNKIVGRYIRNPQMLQGIAEQGVYADVSDADYLTAVNTVIEAENSFLKLPSDIRDRFSNDPYRLLQFVGDEKNREEGIQLGLFNKPQNVTIKPDRAPEVPLAVPPEGEKSA